MRDPIEVDDILKYTLNTFDDLCENTNWGERGIFFNPGNVLPKGIYILTIKEKDGPNDRASNVDRAGVFRVNLGVPKSTYIDLFGAPPARPPAGGIVDTGHDFQQLNQLMPHPVYGWMSWICVLNPSLDTLNRMQPMIMGAVELARGKFEKRIRSEEWRRVKIHKR